jgi:hypothetical protein
MSAAEEDEPAWQRCQVSSVMDYSFNCSGIGMLTEH